MADKRKGIAKAFFLSLATLFYSLTQALAQTHFIDLSKSANRGLAESFDESFTGIKDLQEKNGLKDLPTGSQTFRGIPFQVLDPVKNQGHSFVVLKSRRKPDFPDGVSIPTGNLKASYLYFLHTCRWGGTAQNITVAEYDIVYDDGQVTVIPLRVGVEFTNFFGADDTAASFLAWWHKYKNTEMGVNLFPWKNPRPDQAIQSILFKSRGSMPVPLLFAITASDKELTVSSDSPKPEKTFQTDTSKWIPFESSGASPSGTAIDMSFLLDAPAGKHGKVKADGEKLVFEDGTSAKFWGVQLSSAEILNEKPDPIRDLVDHLSSSGCNAVLVDGEINKNLRDILKAKGIYVCIQKENLDTGKDKGATLDSNWKDDAAIFTSDLIATGKREWGIKLPMEGLISDSVTLIPTNFMGNPMVMAPEESLPLVISQKRVLGTPFAGQWLAFWPNEYLAETPLILSAFASLEGWVGSFGMNGNLPWGETLNPFVNLFDQPHVYSQWPVAALAYLRGDIKEGRVYVLDKDGSHLKALAHKSGLQPENGKFKTDRAGELKAKINEKTKSFVSDTDQITWQGNVGVVKVEAPRFQALIGFLSHRKFNNAYWAVETPNPFTSLSVISLTKGNISLSDHLLVTGVTRMENTGQIYNAAKTKLISPGKAPILMEPLSAKFVLYRSKADPKLRIRALDSNGQPLKSKVPAKWVKNSFVFSWVPSAFYLEIFK